MRPRLALSRFTVATALALLIGTGPAPAQESAPAADQPATAELLQPTPSPPPGISIMPAPPYMAPPAGDGPVSGCPAGRLKKLDLVV